MRSINRHTEMEAVAHLQLEELKTEYKNLKTLFKEEVERREELETATKEQEIILQREAILICIPFVN